MSFFRFANARKDNQTGFLLIGAGFPAILYIVNDGNGGLRRLAYGMIKRRLGLGRIYI